MPSTTMPPGGGIQYNGLWYTPQEWQASGMGASVGGGSAQDQATVDGKQILEDFLNNYGLQGLNFNQVWQAYVASGSNMDYLMNTWLPQQAAFKAAYPAYDTLMKEGRGITVQQYRDYINNAQSEAHAAGFPTGTITQDTITNWLLGGVNAQEAQQRILDAGKAVNQLDKNSQSYLAMRELGVTDGDLAAAFFDEKTALPILENKLAAAQIGGASTSAGLDAGTGLANQLALAGVTANQARTGFNQLANSQELLTGLPGQQGQPSLTQDQAAQGVFGTSGSAATQLQKTAAQRKAVFQQGGGFTANSQGIVGAGVSKSA